MARTRFENLRVYLLAEEIADLSWEVVVKWSQLAQSTVGRQLVNSATALVLISQRDQVEEVMLITGDLLK